VAGWPASLEGKVRLVAAVIAAVVGGLIGFDRA